MQISENILKDTSDFQLIETMVFRHHIRFLDDHLERMRLSARVFQIPFNEHAVRGEVTKILGTLDISARYKIRVTVSRAGDVVCEKTKIYPECKGDKSLCVSPIQIDSGNLFFYHKTTRRGLYESEYTRAQNAGFYEILFLNEKGMVTEASRNNVLVKIQGKTYTPPLKSGLLGGVYRKKILQRCGKIIEAELSLSDLKRASAIYLSNAVRGLRKITPPLVLPELKFENR